jgi:peroxiredoxin Q/BCP
MTAVLLLTAALAVPADNSATRPGPGDVAPAFSAPASDGTTIRLADYAGEKMVVLAFFPKAFTGG